ncbi:hypothetical protein PsYK624_145560 [Phanerochaete sordida]|uniref:DUF6533 domain-containing protein n=1 Tax=Phanerochaete sordida TaxID=48140 RepID=A0A9P3GM46_9APHY|nr:hypothetical protein PsYK624_145560 [Phanerochaete sordida]
MSQTTEVLQQELRDNLIVSYEEYSLLCLVVYEFIVTLDEELTVVWRRRPTATSMLLLIMRWIMLLGPIVQTVPARPTWCRSQYAWNIAVFLVTTAVIALFSALRVYALWQGSRLRHLLAGIVFVFGAVPVATNIFAATHASGFSYDPVFSACEVRINVSPELNANTLRHKRQRNPVRRSCSRTDVDQVLLAVQGNATSGSRFICLNRAAERWDPLFSRPSGHQHPAAYDILRHLLPGCICCRLPPVTAPSTGAALHAKPSTARPHGEREQFGRRPFLPLLHQLPSTL